MIKNFSLLSIIFSLAIVSYAQQKVTLGKPYAVIDADQKFYFAKDGEILTVKTTDKTVTLQKLNAVSLTFKNIKLYDDFPKKFQLEKMVEIKDHYYLFYSYWDGENEQLFYREIDFASGSFKSQGKKLISVNEKISGSVTRAGFWSYSVSDKFDFFFSKDNSTMVIQYRLKPKAKNDSKNFDEIGMHVFDPELKQRWAATVTMPYVESKMDNLDYSVDRKGNVYIVARVYDDNTTDIKKRDKEEANYHLEIFKAAAPTGKIVASKVNINDKFIKTIWMYETAQGYMICAGFYNKGKASSNVDGAMVFKMAEDGRMYDFNTYEIPVELLNQNASRKEKRKNEKKDDDDKAEFEYLNLQNIIVNDDGSIVLLSEQRYSITRTSYSQSGGSSSITTYYCNDILVTKINASGKLAWMRKLPKRQQGYRGYEGMSYAYFSGKNEDYFMFLDNERNLDLRVDEVPAIHVDGAGGFLMTYKVNKETGAVTKISLLDTKNINGMEVYQFKPTRILATAPSTIVFEAYKKKKEDILVKVVLE